VSGAPRFLVVGCGAIGGVVAASLAETGQEVAAVNTNPAYVTAVRARGLQILEDGQRRRVEVPVHLEVPADAGSWDFVILATQPPQVEAAARSAVGALKPDGRIVCMQNGLCEERIAALAGADRTIGTIVAWGATQVEPGVVDRTSAGGFTVGRLDGAADPRVEEIGRALEAIGPVQYTANLRGARWSKLALNCAISGLGTLGGDRLGALLRHRFARRLALEIMSEVVAVARAEKVQLEKVSGTLDLEWIALTDAERRAAGSPGLVAKHTLLLAVGQRYRRLRSSMLAAIERGRPPAVDFLNGEVAARAPRHGLAAPLNATVQRWVHDIAAARRRPGLDLLHALYDQTREESAPAQNA